MGQCVEPTPFDQCEGECDDHKNQRTKHAMQLSLAMLHTCTPLGEGSALVDILYRDTPTVANQLSLSVGI